MGDDRRRRGLVAVVIALVAYAVLKRPGDKSCPAPCTITSDDAGARQRASPTGRCTG